MTQRKGLFIPNNDTIKYISLPVDLQEKLREWQLLRASNTTNSTTAVNSTSQTHNEDDTAPKSNKLTYIIVSICSVVLIGLTIACFVYRQQLNSIKSKYFASNSITDQCQLSVVKMEKNTVE